MPHPNAAWDRGILSERSHPWAHAAGSMPPCRSKSMIDLASTQNGDTETKLLDTLGTSKVVCDEFGAVHYPPTCGYESDPVRTDVH